MKQKLLLKTMLLLFALVVGSGMSWADTSTLTFTAACGGSGTANDGAVWTVTSDGTESNFDSTKGIHYGTNSAQVKYITLSTSDISGTITKVVVNASTANSVSATVGVTIDGDAFGGDAQSLSTSAADYTFNGSASGEIVVTVTKLSKATKAIYVKSITVTYTSGGGGASTVSTPTFDPKGGNYTSAQSVGINCETGSATIRYTMTTDGTEPDDPTESDAVYSSKISVTKSGTIIKAKAFKAEMTASSIATATYTIKPNKPTVSAAGATVTISGDDGLTFYYTTDGSAPSNTSTEYTTPFNMTEDCTIKAIAYDANGNASDASTAFKFKYLPLSPKNIGSGYYEKVIDASSLENGDAILILNEKAKVALSTTQNSSNRSETDVKFIKAGVIYAPSASVQKLVLVAKNEKVGDVDTDVFYFYTGGAGYLYASSSSSNQLKTEDAPDENNNARATIAISSGNATITFKGTATRNLLKYNSSSKIFSCYGSGQEDIQIYKEVAHNESVKLNASGYATFASTYALDFSDDTEFSAWQITDITTSAITFSQIKGAVAAGTGVLLKGTASSTINIPVAASGSDISATNKLEGITTATAITEDQYYGLSGNKFVKVNPGTVKAGKALLPASAITDGARELQFVFEDETTAIRGIENGQLRMENSFFDLQGRKIAKPTKGLYIKNGKKVIVK